MNKCIDKKISVLMLLQMSCVFIFIGRAWQHLFWESPLRVLLWDEGLLGQWVENTFHLSWFSYVTSPLMNQLIQMIIWGIGGIFIASALISMRSDVLSRFQQAVLLIGSALLTFLAFLYCKDKFFRLGEFFEHAIQFGTPLALLYCFQHSATLHRLQIFLKALIVLTFVSHGLYAIGYYPVPGNFQDMTLSILPLSNQYGLLFLKIAGILDLCVAAMICLGLGTTPALMYAVFWGTATAMARVMANVSVSTFIYDLHQWLPETVYRLPHGIIPLATLVLHWQMQKQQKLESAQLLADLDKVKTLYV